MDQTQIAKSKLQVLSEAFGLAATFIRSESRVEDYFGGYSTAEMMVERLKQIEFRIAAVTSAQAQILEAIKAARQLAPQAGLAYTTDPEEPDEFTLGPDVA